VILNEFLCCVDGRAHAFNRLLDDSAGDSLNALGD
jgi:hypothetical protein